MAHLVTPSLWQAIYRHIRLKKGFVNVEEIDGVSKLKIPNMLLQEKIRTQTRFEVRKRPYYVFPACTRACITTGTRNGGVALLGHTPTCPDQALSSVDEKKHQTGRACV